MGDLDDLAGRPLNTRNPTISHLAHYMNLLAGEIGADHSPPLAEHIGSTLLDLIALALAGNRDAAECARLRGRPAARLKSILAELRAGYADPQFTPHRVAATLGLSTRYVQDLLHANGPSFSARVLGLRLQQARRMLLDSRHDRMRVSDIALACGFNEVSYFNRCYRKRFGAAPLDHRNEPPPPATDVEGPHRWVRDER